MQNDKQPVNHVCRKRFLHVCRKR